MKTSIHNRPPYVQRQRNLGHLMLRPPTPRRPLASRSHYVGLLSDPMERATHSTKATPARPRYSAREMQRAGTMPNIRDLTEIEARP